MLYVQYIVSPEAKLPFSKYLFAGAPPPQTQPFPFPDNQNTSHNWSGYAATGGNFAGEWWTINRSCVIVPVTYEGGARGEIAVLPKRLEVARSHLPRDT